MGDCMGKPDANTLYMRELKKMDDKLDKAAHNKKVKDSVHRVLLLGAGESGKSTVLKQMKLLHGDGIAFQSAKPHLKENIEQALKELIRRSEYLIEEKVVENDETRVTEANKALCDEFMSAEQLDFTDVATRDMIKTLWNDEGIQRTFSYRGTKYYLQDNVDYLMGRLDYFFENDWTPNDEDILRIRARTTGLVRENFKINGQSLQMIDVGGQKTERRKWIHQFDDVRAVIFMCALSEYDQTMFEDEDTNRMHDSIELFERVVKLHWFNNSTILLFLNKRDLFEDKFKRVSLKLCFPDYPEEVEDQQVVAFGLDFIIEKFMARVPRYHNVIVHITTATDKGNMEKVLGAVHTSIINDLARKIDMM